MSWGEVTEAQAAWALAFVSAQRAMPGIGRSKTATIPTKSGGQFSYSYADLPTIIDAVRPVLAERELGFAQSVEVYEGGVAVITRIYHSQGHVEIFGPIVLPHAGDARSAGSAITYARRYALCAALGIAADEDDDAQSAGSGGRSGSPSRSRAQAKPSDSAPTSGSEAGSPPTAEAGADGDAKGTPPEAPASPDCPHENVTPRRAGWVTCNDCDTTFTPEAP